MKDATKIKIITFRVTDDEYTKLENAGLTSGFDPNNWCRHAALSCSRNMLTINERMIYTEIALLRYLLAHGFNMLFSGDSDEASAWSEFREQAEQGVDPIFNELLLRRRRGER
jgi:hypothetical protein